MQERKAWMWLMKQLYKLEETRQFCQLHLGSFFLFLSVLFLLYPVQASDSVRQFLSFFFFCADDHEYQSACEALSGKVWKGKAKTYKVRSSRCLDAVFQGEMPNDTTFVLFIFTNKKFFSKTNFHYPLLLRHVSWKTTSRRRSYMGYLHLFVRKK